MNTLWSFGDSFTHMYDHTRTKIYKEHWINQIAEQLEYDNKAFGVSGSSLSYTFAKFYEIRNLIQPNDVVLVCLTSLEREWFFPDRPHFAVLHGLDNDMHNTYTTQEERNAIKQYILHLSDNKKMLNTVYLHNFLESLNRIAKEKNVKIIVMTCFHYNDIDVKEINEELHNIHIADGFLYNISKNEIKDTDAEKYILVPFDRRIGHMLKRNHTILANKILNYLNNNESIDLNTGFFENVVNKEFVNNKELCMLELFENGDAL